MLRSLRLRTAALLAPVLACAALATLVPVQTAGAAVTVDGATAESEFLQRLNSTRSAHGLPALIDNPAVADTSRAWSGSMMAAGAISHDPNYVAKIAQVVPDWSRVGENVGMGGDIARLHDAFYASPGHRANMLGDYNQVGIGARVDTSGTVWVTFRFVKGSLPKPSANEFRLRNSNTSGSPAIVFEYGKPTDTAFVGDWDGDGIDTIGVRRGDTFYLRNSNSTGPAHITFRFGKSTDKVVVGDWNGDGKDTIGVRRSTVFYLRNSNSSGSSHLSFSFGRSTDRALVGDWNGDGKDTIGVRRSTVFYLRNKNSGGSSHLSFSFGRSTDKPLVGDWDGNGTDTIGVRRGTTHYLRNRNSGGSSHISFSYGLTSDRGLVGDWDGRAGDAPGVRRSS